MKRRGVLGLLGSIPFIKPTQADVNAAAVKHLVKAHLGDGVSDSVDVTISSPDEDNNPAWNAWDALTKTAKKQLRKTVAKELAYFSDRSEVAYHLNGMPTHLYTMNSTSITWRMIKARQWHRDNLRQQKELEKSVVERLLGYWDDDIYYGS